MEPPGILRGSGANTLNHNTSTRLVQILFFEFGSEEKQGGHGVKSLGTKFVNIMAEKLMICRA